MEAILIFTAQYLMVLLLGLQSLNVNTGHMKAAAFCSTLLGVCGYHITATIASAKGATGSTLWWAFIIAGPCGIVTSMWLHPKLRNLLAKKESK